MLDAKSGRKHALTLVLLIALQLAASTSLAFDGGKLYRYKFFGTIASKMASDERSQFAGIAISSPVLLKKTGSDELTIKLEQPQLATFNEPMDDPQEPGKQFDYKPMDKSNSLNKAFRIYLDTQDGSVRAFDTFKDEPRWVSNFKRGLLSFFQLKLRAGGEQSSTSGPQGGQFFTTPEKSVFGECETDYLIRDGNQDSKSMNITKTRNISKCKSRYMHRYAPSDSSECMDFEKELQPFRHSNAIFTYRLAGDKQDYVIEGANLDEMYTFAPFGQKSRTERVETCFSLDLQSTDSGGSLSADSGATRTDSLAYEPPEVVNFYANVNLDDEHFLANVFQTTATVEQTMETMDVLATTLKSYTSAAEGSGAESAKYLESAPMNILFLRLNELVSTLNVRQLDQLYSQLDDKGESHKRIFWEVMSVTGTNPSFMFMKKLITEGDAPAVKIKDYLTKLSFHIKAPSKSLFDEYVNLCKSDKIQTDRQYKYLCSLPLASLIHQHCMKPHSTFMRLQAAGANATVHKKGQNICQISTADEYYSRLVQQFGSGSSTEGDEMSISDKMFNIKMAGELGVKPSIEFMTEILRNKNEHPSLRAAAMWGINKASDFYPSIVKRLVAPYYYDTSETLEVRIAAMFNWMRAGLSLHEFEVLAKTLETEPNRQLVLYVHSVVKSLADLPQMSCGHLMGSASAKLVLPTIQKALAKHEPYAFGDSHGSISADWQPEHGYGSLKYYSAIYGDDSFTPSQLYFSTEEIMLNSLRVVPMTISVHAHGLDKLLKRVMGINGLLSDKESFMDVFSLKRRSKRQANLIEQEAREIDKELKLETRDFGDVYLIATISYYGRPLTVIEKDSRELKKMLSEDGTIKIPHIKKLLHSFNNHTSQQMTVGFERTEFFNNELGWPLFQNLRDFRLKTFKMNSIKLDVEPGFFKDERQGKPPTKVGVQVDAKLVKQGEFFSSNGLLLIDGKKQLAVGFLKKVLINAPIKMGIEANLAEQKVIIKRQPIHDNLMYMKHAPATFVRSFDPGQPPNKMIDARPLYASNNSALMKQFKLEYMTPLAIGLKAEGTHKASLELSMSTVRRQLNKMGLAATKFALDFATNGVPFEARLSTITTNENPTKEMSTIISWRHYRGDEPTSSEDKELEQVTSSRSADPEQKPTTVRYELAIVGGSTKERKVSLGLGYSRSFDHMLHKWRLFYQRTPLNQAGDPSSPYSEATNLCWIGQLEFPKYDVAKWLKFDLLQMDHTANMTSEITFGDQCNLEAARQAESSNQPRVSIDTRMAWSREQRRAIENIISGSQGPTEELGAEAHTAKRLASMYRRCLERRREAAGILLEPSCLQSLFKMSELTHLKSSIDYQDVPARWTKLLSKVGSMYTQARSGYVEEMDEGLGKSDYTAPESSRVKRAYLEANLTSCSYDRKLSYEINAPGYHVVYKNVPFALPPLSTFPLAGASYYQMAKRRAGSRFCSIGGQSVSTFDNYTFNMPPVSDGCFKLLAKDCSPEGNFIVLSAQAGVGNVVKIYVANKFKVEFMPDKEGKSVADIKVNGESVKIEPNKGALKQTTKLGPNTKEAFSIENNGAYYTLNSKLYKFSVSTDGNWIFIQESKYYAGKSCGICGDANGDQLLEFKSPMSPKRVCKNSHDFVWSHVIPSSCASRPTNVEC